MTSQSASPANSRAIPSLTVAACRCKKNERLATYEDGWCSEALFLWDPSSFPQPLTQCRLLPHVELGDCQHSLPSLASCSFRCYN